MSSFSPVALNTLIRLMYPISGFKGNPQIQLNPLLKSGSSQQILKILLVTLIFVLSYFSKYHLIRTEGYRKNSPLICKVALKDAPILR